jgi:hypothetical protein
MAAALQTGNIPVKNIYGKAMAISIRRIRRREDE